MSKLDNIVVREVLFTTRFRPIGFGKVIVIDKRTGEVLDEGRDPDPNED